MRRMNLCQRVDDAINELHASLLFERSLLSHKTLELQGLTSYLHIRHKFEYQMSKIYFPLPKVDKRFLISMGHQTLCFLLQWIPLWWL
jgi:hypothetical protein